MAAVVITGLAEVTARLAEVITRMEEAGAVGVEHVGKTVIGAAQRFCPVDTGRLRDSLGGGPDGVDSDGLKSDPDARGPGVLVGSNVEYAAYVEFGTYKMAAEPYLRPGLEVGRSTGEAELAATIRAGMV